MKSALKTILMYFALVASGVAIDQLIVSKRLSLLEEKVTEQIKVLTPTGKFMVAEMYQSPEKDSFYLIRLNANPDEKVDPYNFEIYLDSLRRTYFPSSSRERTK